MLLGNPGLAMARLFLHALSIWCTASTSTSSTSTTICPELTSDVLEQCLKNDDGFDSIRLLQKRSEQTLEGEGVGEAVDSGNAESAGNLGCQEVVDLSGQRIETWPTLKNCPSLQILDLSNNSLKNVPNNAFTSIPNLRILRLSMNLITSFPSITSLKRLWELDLSFNRIESLPSGALKENSELTTLNLRHNKLKHLPSFASWLGEKNELNFLTLANNQIASIASSTSESSASTASMASLLDSLDWLDLSGNQLSYLGAHFAKDVKNVDNLVLTGNPFSCRGIDVTCTSKGTIEDQTRFVLPMYWCTLPLCYSNENSTSLERD